VWRWGPRHLNEWERCRLTDRSTWDGTDRQTDRLATSRVFPFACGCSCIVPTFVICAFFHFSHVACLCLSIQASSREGAHTAARSREGVERDRADDEQADS